MIYEDYQNLKLNALSIRSKYEALQSQHITSVESLNMLNQELNQAIISRNTLLSSITVMKQLIDILSPEQISQLISLLTSALQTIFTDRNYSIDIRVSESRSVKQAQFILIETFPDGSVIESSFQDSIGGGILSVVGLIIQVYYILYYNQYPILFMDEALSQVSTQYLPSVLEFIHQLSVKKHFKFVLITHDDRLIDYADSTYIVSKGVVTHK